MKNRRATSWTLAGLMLGFGTAPLAVAETTIHTWLDAAGVRHFSQEPPGDEDQQVRTIELESIPPAPDGTDRVESMREVARDLEQARELREQARAAESAPALPAGTPTEQAVTTYMRPAPLAPYGYFGYPYPYAQPYPPPYPRPGREPGVDRSQRGAPFEPPSAHRDVSPPSDARISPPATDR